MKTWQWCLIFFVLGFICGAWLVGCGHGSTTTKTVTTKGVDSSKGRTGSYKPVPKDTIYIPVPDIPKSYSGSLGAKLRSVDTPVITLEDALKLGNGDTYTLSEIIDTSKPYVQKMYTYSDTTKMVKVDSTKTPKDSVYYGYIVVNDTLPCKISAREVLWYLNMPTVTTTTTTTLTKNQLYGGFHLQGNQTGIGAAGLGATLKTKGEKLISGAVLIGKNGFIYQVGYERHF